MKIVEVRPVSGVLKLGGRKKCVLFLCPFSPTVGWVWLYLLLHLRQKLVGYVPTRPTPLPTGLYLWVLYLLLQKQNKEHTHRYLLTLPFDRILFLAKYQHTFNWGRRFSEGAFHFLTVCVGVS